MSRKSFMVTDEAGNKIDIGDLKDRVEKLEAFQKQIMEFFAQAPDIISRELRKQD